MPEADVISCFHTFLLPLRYLTQQLRSPSGQSVPLEGVIEPLVFLLEGTHSAVGVASQTGDVCGRNMIQVRMTCSRSSLPKI
jgi:hypothetical protein